jgi:hypothetical protein
VLDEGMATLARLSGTWELFAQLSLRILDMQLESAQCLAAAVKLSSLRPVRECMNAPFGVTRALQPLASRMLWLPLPSSPRAASAQRTCRIHHDPPIQQPQRPRRLRRML